MPSNININLAGKDNLSPALKNASVRLAELRTEIDRIRAKGNLNLTVADTKNLDRLTNQANRLEKALGGVTTQTASTSAGFAALGKALPYAALASFAVGAGKALWSLEQMREESDQIQARFVGFTGSVQNASNALDAMDSALGNALSRDQKMSAATQLLGLGIANTAQEAATLTNQALIMGMSIETLTQALETGRVNGLVQYGISVSDVKTRTEELQKADASLSDTEARSLAIKEQLAAKSDAIAAAGGRAATATQEMKNAFDTLKDSAADFVNLETGINVTTESMTRLAAVLSGIKAGKDISILEPGSEGQLNAITERLAYLRDLADRPGVFKFIADDARRQIAELEADLVRLTPANEAAGASAGLAAVRMVDAAIQVQGAVGGMGEAIDASGEHWKKFEALGVAAANRVKSEMLIARAASMGIAEPTTPAPAKSRWGLYAEWGKSRVDSGAGDLVNDWQARMTKANKDIAGTAASDYASAMKNAASEVQSDIENALSGAQSASKGLFDFGKGAGDLFAPGSNGSFEAIFRAQSIAVHGTGGANEQMWAQMYGLTQESAKKIVTDFQAGLFSADVQKLINVDQLVGQIQGEQAAADSSAAFAKLIAGKLGVKDAGALVASQTYQAIAGGVDADPAQQTAAAQKVLDAYLANVESVVTGKDYAGRMIAFGQTTWVYYEQGLLEGASTSAVFAQAVYAAIYAFMAAQPGAKSNNSGVVATATATGVSIP